MNYAGHPEEAIDLIERGMRLSPTDPRLFLSLHALAGAYYQAHQYHEAVEAGRRSWTLNRSWTVGLRYVVAGLGQLGRLEEAAAALAELQRIEDLAYVIGVFRLYYQQPEDVDHFIEGLRKAGMQ